MRGASVTWRPGEFDVAAESGGFLGRERETFSPVREVQPGVIRIEGPGFLRGDANADGTVDLSDAVATLTYLFGGGREPECMDASDADDSGVVEITDPIFLLGALFLGLRQILPPHPECGADGTRDDLGCGRSCP